MNISLSDHFTYKKLLRFTFPSIVMMILTSIYGVVDGVFVSNFVGSEAFASINIIIPVPKVRATRALPPLPVIKPMAPRIMRNGIIILMEAVRFF